MSTTCGRLFFFITFAPDYITLYSMETTKHAFESRAHLAAEKKLSGATNCAQAVAVTYADITGLSPESMAAATAAFGTGMGTMRGTCGALVGAGVVCGMLVPDRVKARAVMKGMFQQFEHRCGAATCAELKGVGTGTPLTPCHECVRHAAEILESVIENL